MPRLPLSVARLLARFSPLMDPRCIAKIRSLVREHCGQMPARQHGFATGPAFAALAIVASLFMPEMPVSASASGVRAPASRLLSAAPQVTGVDGSQTGTANFVGNFTEFGAALPNLFLLQRQADCSLNYITGTATPNGASVALTITGNTPHYELTLHQLASLKTTPDLYPLGCKDPGTGISSRSGVYVGMPQSGTIVSASVIPNGNFAAEIRTRVYRSPYSSNPGTIQSSLSNASGLATADLNKDGSGDLVVVNGNFATSSYIAVMLGNADGTFQSPVSYSTAGSYTVAAVIDDVNGDGKLDIVAVSADQQISVLLGKGDGTFQSALSFAVPALPGFSSASAAPIVNLITADLRGVGKKDVICSNGLVLLGNGDGTFTPVATPAFPYFLDTVSINGPNIASGDINKDGKIDLVLDNSSTISIWTGNGDGTFTRGNSYSTINTIGFITLTDLDGDGNLDIYSGLANGGLYSGDQGDYSTAYVLMGNGDGTFQGAPQVGYGEYTGNNLGDVTGTGTIDLITNTVNTPYGIPFTTVPTFTVQMSTGKGTFKPISTITPPASFSLNGYSITGANTFEASTYAVGDINGDGKADLVFADNDLYGGGSLTGLPAYFTSISNGDGTFQTPVPHAFPQVAPAGDFDNGLTVDSLQITNFKHGGPAGLVFSFNETAGVGTGGPPVNPYNQGLLILPGNGNGSFGTPIVITTLSSTTAINTNFNPVIAAIADLNGDGNPDLVVIANSFVLPAGAQSQVEIFLGNGDGTFQAPTTISTPANPTSLVLSDLNKDGILDMAVKCGGTNANVDQIAVLLGNGHGAFTSASTLNVSPDVNAGATLAAADFNGDGNVDLATINPYGYTGIFYGNGSGTFTSVNVGSYVLPKDLVNFRAQGAALALDLNGDGKPDILAGNTVLLSESAPTTGTLVTPTLTVTPSPASITTAQSTQVTVAVSGGSGAATATGSISLSSGTYTSAATTLANGSVIITIPAGALSTGTDTLNATYTPDSASASVYNGASGTNTVIVTTAPVPSFGLSNGGNVSFAAASTTGNTATITVTPSNGFTGTVNLSCAVTTIPAGAISPATCAVTPSVSITGNTAQSGTLTVTTTSTTTPGAYAVTVTGTSGSITQPTIVGVTVTAFLPPPTFTLGNGGNINIQASATTGNTSTITATPANGFTGAVSLSCAVTTAPAGAVSPATCAITPTVTITGASAQTGTLTVTTTQTTTAGAYAVTVTGISGGITQTTTVNITVTAFVAPAFALSNSGTLTIATPGATTGNTATITVTPSAGFTGAVALTAVVATSPTGATNPPTFSFGATTPVTITGASAATGTLTVSTSAAGGCTVAYQSKPALPWYAGGSALACVLLLVIPSKRRWRKWLAMVLFAVALTSGVAACGGSGSKATCTAITAGTTLGNYTITATGTAGNITQTTTVNLTVN